MITIKPLRLEDIDNEGRSFMLFDDFKVLMGNTTYTAPRGTLTDGASIPRILWRVIGSPFVGRYRKGAVMHDAIYRGAAKINLIPISISPISRKEADQLFLRMMKDSGVSWMRRHMMYRAVRMFGASSWT